MSRQSGGPIFEPSSPHFNHPHLYSFFLLDFPFFIFHLSSFVPRFAPFDCLRLSTCTTRVMPPLKVRPVDCLRFSICTSRVMPPLKVRPVDCLRFSICTPRVLSPLRVQSPNDYASRFVLLRRCRLSRFIPRLFTLLNCLRFSLYLSICTSRFAPLDCLRF